VCPKGCHYYGSAKSGGVGKLNAFFPFFFCLDDCFAHSCAKQNTDNSSSVSQLLLDDDDILFGELLLGNYKSNYTVAPIAFSNQTTTMYVVQCTQKSKHGDLDYILTIHLHRVDFRVGGNPYFFGG
jgi:hypothetical protein